jgi:hypothetical protein
MRGECNRRRFAQHVGDLHLVTLDQSLKLFSLNNLSFLNFTHGAEYEFLGLPDCNAVYFGDIPTFRRNISPPSKKPAEPGNEHSFTLKMKAVYLLETSGFLRTTRHYNTQSVHFNIAWFNPLKTHVSLYDGQPPSRVPLMWQINISKTASHRNKRKIRPIKPLN